MWPYVTFHLKVSPMVESILMCDYDVSKEEGGLCPTWRSCAKLEHEITDGGKHFWIAVSALRHRLGCFQVVTLNF